MKPTGLGRAGIAAGAIVAACGDDTRRLTKETFIEQAVDEGMPHFERQLDQRPGLDPPLDDEELIAGSPDDHDMALAESAELVEAAAGVTTLRWQCSNPMARSPMSTIGCAKTA